MSSPRRGQHLHPGEVPHLGMTPPVTGYPHSPQGTAGYPYHPQPYQPQYGMTPHGYVPVEITHVTDQAMVRI